MKEFNVFIISTRTEVYKVRSKNEDEALEIARDKYWNGESGVDEFNDRNPELDTVEDI